MFPWSSVYVLSFLLLKKMLSAYMQLYSQFNMSILL